MENSTTTRETFRDRLISIRKKHDLTQQEAADLVGVPATSWANWESTAKVVIPRPQTIESIAKAFEVSPKWLFSGVGTPEISVPVPKTEEHLSKKYNEESVRYTRADEQKLRDVEECIKLLKKIYGVSKDDKRKLYKILNELRGEVESIVLFGRDNPSEA